jgi:[protein-PII] uridylyltransferase
MTASTRSDRTQQADTLCVEAFEKAGAPVVGVSLVAVGGYGRGELAPYSDLDVVLVHDEDVGLGQVAEDLWYPLWDSGTKLDHAVRSLPEMVATSDEELKVALGLLDVRHLAGDPNLTLRLRTTMLTRWRRDARSRLPALQELVRTRHERVGELAHLSVPDLKEAAGGLRDATVLKALVASWLVDVPHVELEKGRRELLDVRDVLHELNRRGSDRVSPEAWDDLARGLDLPDDAAAQRHVREIGRRLTHLSRLTWRRVDAVLARPVAARPRRPDLTPIAPGLALSSGEVVLGPGAQPSEDPLLLLRAAAEAAERDAVLAPATAARLAREAAPLPDPWPAGARQLLVRLLAAGRGLLPVWETLEETGALAQVLPEWQRIRLLPHASPIHRFTVDRHVVETCIEASSLIRHVARPDVLVVAALLHDIGKGGLTEHSVAGEPIARAIAARIGFDDDAVAVIGRLVRRHLLLVETATTRDPEDPATVALVADAVEDAETVSLLRALTEADARAASAKAWSTWRAGLVDDLTRRVLATFDERPPALVEPAGIELPAVAQGEVSFTVTWDDDDGARVTAVAHDRVGLLADVAAVFALQKASVRAARAWAEGEYAVSQWDVADDLVETAVLRQRFDAVVEGRVDPAARLSRRAGAALAASVEIRPEASRRATVLEVRAADRPGVLYLTLAALARLEITVRSAHVDTLGPQAVDVFYLQESSAGALSETRAAEAAHAVRSALDDPPT